jgi:predicted TIM-barrel fold metal-dependent hydrolase
MAHLTSLVFEGAFELFPDLKIVCVEGGFSWLAPLLWRLDNQWQALAPEGSHLRRPPSSYVKDHVRLTTQPVEEPVRHQDLLRLMGWMEAERLLMFSTDYPHYDFDDPSWVLPRLPKESRARICSQNAIDLYGLPSHRPLDALDRARHEQRPVPTRPAQRPAESAEATQQYAE